MRKNQVRIGQRYIMQRGPTRRSVLVTLVAKDAPSEMGNRVVVRIDEGVGKGNEREAPTVSIFPLSGNEPAKSPKKSPGPEPVREAPIGWKPRKNEQVTWTQTLAISMTVIEVDTGNGIAVIEGYVFGGLNRYDAPIPQLCPIKPTFTPVRDLPTRRDSVPSHGEGGEALEPEQDGLPLVVGDEQILDRLTFAPKLIAFYRNKFARRKTLAKAEAQLRSELKSARVRRKHPGQYLTLVVPGRYEIPLKQRPVSDDPESCYVRGITVMKKDGRRAA
ncbi:MAG: hypothetical protein ACJ76D_01605 [Solirubrobacterales bacterium]